MGYFDTTFVTAEDKVKYRNCAETQEKIIGELFSEIPDGSASASQVLSELIRRGELASNTPITSIRRAINCLAKEGVLRKTGENRTGLFGRPELLWKLNK
jgi:Fe2+ or Zn2+ uptake regulation protein